MTRVVVSRLTHEAEDVIGLELRHPDGQPLPRFKPGSHIDLQPPAGACRQYSLTNSSDESDRYCLGVALASKSRGGSRFVHRVLKPGDILTIGEPRNLFALVEDADLHLFVAGGIGITPILSMIRWCEARAKRWRLLYAVRSMARAPFLWDLAPYRQQVDLHVDESHDGKPADVYQWLNEHLRSNSCVYTCGPGGLMDAVARDATALNVSADRIRSERFSADPPTGSSNRQAISLVLARSGRDIEVRVDESVLDALERSGIEVPFSCREGLCRTCETPVLEGDVDHRDHVLDANERMGNKTMLVCVSRCRGSHLVLDL